MAACKKRRVVFQISVVTQTQAEKLKLIPALVKDIILKKQDVTYDRGHFTGFQGSSLNFEFVYFILSADYNFYMDTHQEIWLAILESFKKENIELAFPAQTLYLEAQK